MNSCQEMAPRRIEFANWLITPDRHPASQKELAQQWGLAESTLSLWKRSPEVQAVLRGWRSSYRPAFAEAVDAIFRKAKAGDVQAFRALAEVLGENAPQRLEHSTTLTVADLLGSAKWTRPGHVVDNEAARDGGSQELR